MKQYVQTAVLPRVQSFVQRYILLIGIGMFVAALSFSGVYAYANSRTSAQIACPVEACISLTGSANDSTAMTVETGSYVQFNSADGGNHNISLAHSAAQHDDPQRYESGDFTADEAWRVQFKEDGAYTFTDTYNSDISITIVAYTPGKEYRIE